MVGLSGYDLVGDVELLSLRSTASFDDHDLDVQQLVDVLFEIRGGRYPRQP